MRKGDITMKKGEGDMFETCKVKHTVLILLSALFATAWAVDGDMGNGDGSENNPYLIEDLDDFDEFASNPAYRTTGVHTKLMTDIDLAGITYATAVITRDIDTFGGSNTTSFLGRFDGNHKTIRNLTIDTAGASNGLLGLFEVVGFFFEDVLIKDLDIENAVITGGDDSGGGILCALLRRNVTIDNCNVSGQVTCGNNSGTVGGLWGLTSNASSTVINNCSARGKVTAGINSTYLGGLCGINDESTISNCNAAVEVTAGTESYDLGGLCGFNQYGTISNSYATGSVSGIAILGGLCGETWSGTISNSYATGSVTSDPNYSGSLYTFNGGLCGVNDGTTINNCYAVGSVSYGDYIGGLCGGNYGTISNCFWDIDTTGQTTSSGGIGKTTTEMMTQSTFTGWDFSTPIWRMLRGGEDYPRLAWQEIFAGDIAGLYGANMVDFAYLANYWGLTGCSSGTDCGRADIDLSGDVGLGDLAAVADDWLKGIGN